LKSIWNFGDTPSISFVGKFGHEPSVVYFLFFL
jgi:hypothetical protein